MQAALALDTPDIDISRFVKFEAATSEVYYTPAGMGRRAGEAGKLVGVITLQHSSGYEALLQFPDGKEARQQVEEAIEAVAAIEAETEE